MNTYWHEDHLACWTCKESLAGKKFIMKDEHPYCLACFEEKFCSICSSCGIKIKPESKEVTHKDFHWHSDCFKCSICEILIGTNSFMLKDNKICCTECYTENYATRCASCNRPFKSGSRKLIYKQKEYHEACFICAYCDNPIGNSSFVLKEGKPCCTRCYDEHFAKRCCQCAKVVESGVVYGDKIYHRECFTCAECKHGLANEKFVTHENKTYCIPCYGNQFSKKCYGCCSPITGDDSGGKYIEFEGRYWHTQCFVCSRCRNNLVNKGFITEGLDILCAKCA